MSEEAVGDGAIVASTESGSGAEPTVAARERHDELARELDEHQYRYYVLQSPSVDDAVYDRLMRELEAIENEFPALRTPDSPSQRVGGSSSKSERSIPARRRPRAPSG